LPKILITNDDGVFSEGIKMLTEALRSHGEIVVVAPDREQSAMSHALTLKRPLRMRSLGDNIYSVDGTPTDCVNLGVLWLLKDAPPDLVVSGINYGYNLGDDVTYSGTVSAAFEASLLGIPAIALSQEVREGFSFDAAARFASDLVGQVLERGLDPKTLLSVNVPATEPVGVELTRLGKRVYQQVVVEKFDPRGERYFWIAGTPEWQDEEGIDHRAVTEGKISVTPLHLDLTDYPALETYGWLERGGAEADAE